MITRTQSDLPTASLLRPLSAGQAIGRWNVSDLFDQYFPGESQRFPDQVTYEFVNGWVDTGDLPCRQALRKLLKTRKAPVPDCTFDQVYLGGDTGEVDFSDFCHRPTLRSAYGRVILKVDQAQQLAFQITTCGGVHVWLNGVACHRFEPFTRNSKQKSNFVLEVPAGAHELVVRFEDLHERDTTFGFRLELSQGTGVQTGISIQADEADLAAAAALLEGLRTTQVFYETANIAVTSDQLPVRRLRLSCPDLPGQGGEIGGDQPEVSFATPSGCLVLRFEIQLGDATLSRSIGTTVLDGLAPIGGVDFDSRKRALLTAQKTGGDIASVLASLRAGRWTAADHAGFEDALKTVEQRMDCADFRLMSLLWIWTEHRADVPKKLRARLQAALLGFRYWMDEPGNDVMWFWSENHVLCFHVAQHLAGQYFPDAVFENSGLTGAQQRDLGQARLMKWFDAIDQHGLAEWNSAAYYPINYRGLLALYQLTDTPVLKDRAKALLDQISVMVALHHCGGVAAGSQGRMYEKELLAGPMTELGAIASTLFGGWHVPGKDAAAVMLALSDYTPPVQAKALAHPAAGATIKAAYVQGLNGGADLALWKSAHAQLSSVQHHMPGQDGHQQHVVDLQFAKDPLARVWVSHPGDLKVWGAARPSYWAGNGRLPDVMQQGRVVRMTYALSPDDIPFTHVFVPQDRLDEVVSVDQWLFLRSGSGFGAVWASGPMILQDQGLYQGSEWRVHGRAQNWIIATGDRDTDGSFAGFQKKCLNDIAGIEAPDLGPLQGEKQTDPMVSVAGSDYRLWSDLTA